MHTYTQATTKQVSNVKLQQDEDMVVALTVDCLDDFALASTLPVAYWHCLALLGIADLLLLTSKRRARE